MTQRLPLYLWSDVTVLQLRTAGLSLQLKRIVVVLAFVLVTCINISTWGCGYPYHRYKLYLLDFSFILCWHKWSVICKNALVPVKGWKCNHLQVFYITSFFNISRATFDEMVRSKDHEIQVSITVYMCVCTNNIIIIHHRSDSIVHWSWECMWK